MNILIVDDNKNNRMILTLLLEDYMEENAGVNFNLDEANDGLQAVNMCREKEFDIVLMDIMMPNMDGIEATKIIRNEHKKIMIIAVSAVDDMERQKLILSNGAEDYISKPVNADIFTARIANYITLIEARTRKKSNEFGLNLFTKEIFNRYTKFMFASEDTLSEFWEYYLLDGDQKYDHLSDVIRTIFSIADMQVRLSVSSEVIVEESEDFVYFTLTNIDKLPAKIIELTLKKNNLPCEYKSNSELLSFKLDKIVSEIVEEVITPITEVPKVVSTTPTVEFVEEVTASVLNYASAELAVYDYIEEEDMSDLEEYTGKLGSLMLMVGGGDVTQEEVIEIYTYLDRIGSILSTYSEVFPISKALRELSADMASHITAFTDNSEALGPMCAAFSRDLESWMVQSFETGAPSVDFMNDTIAVNCQTIGGMLKMDEAPADGADDFDDIFDF